jgi:hypothetical protein
MRPDKDDEEPQIYLVRMTEPAEAEIDKAHFALISSVSPDFAFRWREGILAAINNLSLFPELHQVVEPESLHWGRPVRRLLYRQGRLYYHVLFTLIDADEDGMNDTVRVLHVRNASTSLAEDM